MRYTAVLTVLSLTFSGAMANKSYGPWGWFGPWFGHGFDIEDLKNLDLTKLDLTGLDLTGLDLKDLKLPENPCEFVGGTCEATSLCTGKGDISVALPCGPTGTVGVGCCWHEATTSVWFEQWKEWIEKLTALKTT
ncbi:hypothetical protein GGI35DRAFT_482560 [Trichoderma velutinum]